CSPHEKVLHNKIATDAYLANREWRQRDYPLPFRVAHPLPQSRTCYAALFRFFPYQRQHHVGKTLAPAGYAAYQSAEAEGAPRDGSSGRVLDGSVLLFPADGVVLVVSPIVCRKSLSFAISGASCKALPVNADNLSLGCAPNPAL